MIRVERAELVTRPALAIEDLDGSDPAQPLVEERVEPRQTGADLAEAPAHAAAQRQRGDDDEGQHGKGHAHELGIEAHHRHEDPEQEEYVAHERHEPRGEQLVQDVDVVRDARHDAADRVTVEVRHRQPLQMAEERHAQVQHDVLPDLLHDLRAEIAERQAHEQSDQVEHRHPIEMREVTVTDPIVDRFLGEIGAGELDERFAQRHEHGQGHALAIRPQVGEQPTHEPAVVAATREVLVQLAHEASSSSSSCWRRCSSA